MYARVNTIRNATDIDGGVKYERGVLSELRSQRGYRGLSISGDRASGTASILSMWETKDDLANSETTAGKMRHHILGVMGGDVTVEVFEQLAEAVGDPPPAEGCMLRVRQLQMDPATVEDNLAFFRTMILPTIQRSPGFRAVRNLLDRSTGRGAVGTVWTDVESLRAADASFEERRATVEARGVQFGEFTVAEVLLIDMP